MGAYGLREPVDIYVMKIDGDVELSQLSKNGTIALNDACLTWREAEKAVIKV